MDQNNVIITIIALIGAHYPLLHAGIFPNERRSALPPRAASETGIYSEWKAFIKSSNNEPVCQELMPGYYGDALKGTFCPRRVYMAP